MKRSLFETIKKQKFPGPTYDLLLLLLAVGRSEVNPELNSRSDVYVQNRRLLYTYSFSLHEYHDKDLTLGTYGNAKVSILWQFSGLTEDISIEIMYCGRTELFKNLNSL
ncbi:uncharacterized protein F4812DRAFT_434780, partial [Daldinia caldariorum]|uniref:uncharacterized protein n=1 Tax=Daldinia caldariorum TaxID=326644 RepID=UPI002008A0A8